jgi:hypothetical protein
MMKAKGWNSAALALVLSFFIAGCQTVPVQKAPAVREYTNKHGITFTLPGTWQIEDSTLNYEDLDAAAVEGGAYMQIFSYDRNAAANPGDAVSASEAKIVIRMTRNQENLGYKEVLGGLDGDVIERSAFTINNKQAYKVHYRITNLESGGRLDILSILLIDKGFITRFICYPWNSRYVAQFEKLAGSFRASGK